MQKIRLFLLVSLLVIFTPGCSSNPSNENPNDNYNQEDSQSKDENATNESAKQGGELAIGFISDIGNFDPILSVSGNDPTYLYMIYNTLVWYDSKTLEAIPVLAKSWEQKDEKT